MLGANRTITQLETRSEAGNSKRNQGTYGR
jgi:hypothetical protein